MSDVAKHPWIKGDLRVARNVIERVDAEAVAAYGREEESCGLLLGPDADALLVDEIVPMENRANKLHRLDPETYPRTGRMYFDIDPLKFERAVRAGESNGRPVKVLYHSHLDVGAYFSETYDLAYLVTSVRSGVVDDRKLFVWDGGARAFVETALTIV